MQRDRRGHYVVPETVNGVDVEFLLDTGASDVAIPPAIARRLKLTRGPEVEIRTASDVIRGYLVTLDDVSIGPALTEARARERERAFDRRGSAARYELPAPFRALAAGAEPHSARPADLGGEGRRGDTGPFGHWGKMGEIQEPGARLGAGRAFTSLHN